MELDITDCVIQEICTTLFVLLRTLAKVIISHDFLDTSDSVYWFSIKPDKSCRQKNGTLLSSYEKQQEKDGFSGKVLDIILLEDTK